MLQNLGNPEKQRQFNQNIEKNNVLGYITPFKYDVCLCAMWWFKDIRPDFTYRVLSKCQNLKFLHLFVALLQEAHFLKGMYAEIISE